MTEKELLKIKRGLKKRAKKLHLGKKRTGAYVFGTLRKIRGNPVIFVRNKKDLENVRKQVQKGMIIESVSYTRTGYRVLLSEPRPHYKEVWGESFDEYAARAFPKIHKNPSLAAERLRRQAEILEMDERLVPSTLTYEDIKHDPKLVAHYKKIMTPMAWQNLVRGNPPALFQKGGYMVVVTYSNGEVEFGQPYPSKEEAEAASRYMSPMKRKGAYPYKVEVLPVTKVAKNPPFYAHGLRERKGRMWWGKQVTHGLNVGELRALYKLVKRGHWEATRYAQRKLEIPPSETKSQILAIIDHHIRDLLG